MKEVVWPTKGAHTTFGVTGFLLRHGTERHVELAQAVGMTVVYASAWRALSRGARPEPWLLLALLTFSMTTLWPVVYLYFDGFTLLAAALASSVLAPVRPVRDLAAGLAVLAVGRTRRRVVDGRTPSRVQPDRRSRCRVGRAVPRAGLRPGNPAC